MCDTQFEAFKTFLVDQLKVLMEGLMDPALKQTQQTQETLDYQEVNRRAMASLDKASRQVALVAIAMLMCHLVT